MLLLFDCCFFELCLLDFKTLQKQNAKFELSLYSHIFTPIWSSVLGGWCVGSDSFYFAKAGELEMMSFQKMLKLQVA